MKTETSNKSCNSTAELSVETKQTQTDNRVTEGMFSLDQFAMAGDQFSDDELVQGPLTVRNPGKMEFFKVCDAPGCRVRVCILNDQRNETTYLVSPALRSTLEGDVATAELVLVANQDGEQFLWLAKTPAFDGEHYGTTRMAAISLAKTAWIRIRSRADRKGYDIIHAAGQFPDPQWPTKTLDELCHEAFADRLVTSLDHPALRRLRGETA